MSNLAFKEITSDKDIKDLAALAHKIWNAYYPEIIGIKQVDYMLDRFYSIDVLAYRIKEGDIFIGAYTGNKLIGYISYSVTGEYEYFIHKLYVDIDTHHKGIGRALFRHVFDDKKVNAVRLTVNRKNYKAVNFYFRIGFIIEDVIDIDIENGFFMNDFVMFYK